MQTLGPRLSAPMRLKCARPASHASEAQLSHCALPRSQCYSISLMNLRRLVTRDGTQPRLSICLLLQKLFEALLRVR